MEMENNFFPCKLLGIIILMFGIILFFALLFAYFSCKSVKNANNETPKKAEQGTAENTKSINFNFFFFALIVASCLCAFIIYHTQKCIVRNNELEIERLKIESNSAKNNSAPIEFQNSETKAQIDAQIQLNVKKAGEKK